MLVSDPKSETPNFILIGSTISNRNGNDENRHFIYQISFEKLYDRDCTDSDFVEWIAKKPDGEQDCLMGTKVSFFLLSFLSPFFLKKKRKERHWTII